MPNRITIAVAFAALALIACSKTETPTATDTPTPAAAEQTTTTQTASAADAATQPVGNTVHPCDVLTQADWDAALGPGYTPERANDESCKAKKTLGAEFEVVVRRPEDITREIADDKQYALQPPAATLTGVGDEAYQSGNGNMVIARKGSYYVRVSGGGIMKDAPKTLPEATKFLAERALAKL